jgi:hypothetical protein
MKFNAKQSDNTELVGPVSEEKIASLFQPDVLLTEQYSDNFRRKTPLEPEKALFSGQYPVSKQEKAAAVCRGPRLDL